MDCVSVAIHNDRHFTDNYFHVIVAGESADTDEYDPRIVDDSRVTVTRSRQEAHDLLTLYPRDLYHTVETESDAWRKAAEERRLLAERGNTERLMQQFLGIYANDNEYDVMRWLYETIRDLDGIDTRDMLKYAIEERGHDIEWYRSLLDEIEGRE
jgi:hypothetical protein